MLVQNKGGMERAECFSRRRFVVGLIGVGATGCKTEKDKKDEELAKRRKDAADVVETLGEITKAAKKDKADKPPKKGAKGIGYVLLEELEVTLDGEPRPDLNLDYMSANLWLDAVRDVSGGRKADLRHFESLGRLAYVGVVVPREVKKPKLTDNGFKFDGGTFVGDVLIYSVHDGKLLGGASFAARSSEKVDFKQTGSREGNAAYWMMHDFGEQIAKAAKEASNAEP
jgi:hypothetical protein